MLSPRSVSEHRRGYSSVLRRSDQEGMFEFDRLQGVEAGGEEGRLSPIHVLLGIVAEP